MNSKRIMELKESIQKGNMLFVKFEVSAYTGISFSSKYSKEFIINGLVSFQVQVNTVRIVNGYTSEYTNLIFIKFLKLRHDSTARFRLKVSSVKFDLTDITFISDDSTWRLLQEWKTVNSYFFDIQACVDTMETISSFASLLNDMELTDFTLRGEDASIRVHKAVLAASSPIFRRMLQDKWKGVPEGDVEVPGVTRVVLTQLKNYMYTRVTPDTAFQKLLILSCFYMMPELERVCIDKIIKKLNPQNTLLLSEFAVRNKMLRLHLAILDCIQSGAVQVRELRYTSYEERLKIEKSTPTAPVAPKASQRIVYDRGESRIPKRNPVRSRSRDSYVSARLSKLYNNL